MTSPPLARLRPFEGLCLTAADLIAEQAYHRRSLQRNTRFLSGHGVVQGLMVELEQLLEGYRAVVRAGFGLTRDGQGVHLTRDLVVPIEPLADGEHVLWLLHVEREDPVSARPVYDTGDERPTRIVESVEPALLPAEQEPSHGVAVARLRFRLGRVTHLRAPVPRAGRVERAAASYLAPRVLRFVELARRAVHLLFRTTALHELPLAAYGLYAALAAGELLLLEEGTSDRVLYRSAGVLVRHARALHDAEEVRDLTERVGQVARLLQALDAAVPGADADDQRWQAWFDDFERVLPPLERAVEELEGTVDARAERS